MRAGGLLNIQGLHQGVEIFPTAIAGSDLGHPPFAFVVFHVEVKLRVGIRPRIFNDDAFDGYHFREIVGNAGAVMSNCWNRKHDDAGGHQ